MIACIDIGTNSVRMAVYDKEIDINSEKYLVTTRLGYNVDRLKKLDDDRMKDTLDALKEYYLLAKKQGAEKVYAIATSAVRDSVNKDYFTQKIRDIGIDIEVISGKKEAELGYIGVLGGLKPDGNILIIDIGGGSTELILGKDEIIHSKSLDIGAVRMYGKFVSNEVVTAEEEENIRAYIRNIIKEEINTLKKYDIKKVIGIGGTITTLASMHLELVEYDRKIVHKHVVEYSYLEDINKKLLKETVDERVLHKGLMRRRADIIPCGFIILEELLKALNKKVIEISEYDNLEGLFINKN